MYFLCSYISYIFFIPVICLMNIIYLSINVTYCNINICITVSLILLFCLLFVLFKSLSVLSEVFQLYCYFYQCHFLIPYHLFFSLSLKTVSISFPIISSRFSFWYTFIQLSRFTFSQLVDIHMFNIFFFEMTRP